MSGSSEDLLSALGRLQGADDTAASGGGLSANERVRLLASVLMSAQDAGLTPEQTAELMRGLGIVEGVRPRSATTPPTALTLAPSVPPARLAAVSDPPAPEPPTPEPPPPEPPPPEPPPPERPTPDQAAGDGRGGVEAGSVGGADRTRAELTTAPPPVVEREVVPSQPPSRRPLRRVSVPARVQPGEATSLRDLTSAPQPRRSQAPRERRPLRPTPGKSTRFRLTRPSAPPTVDRVPSGRGDRDGPGTLPPASGVPAIRPRVRSAPPSATRQAQSSNPPAAPRAPDSAGGKSSAPSSRDLALQAELIEDAARALATSLDGLESEFRRATGRTSEAASKPKGPAPARMLDVDISKAPPFKGDWTWHDTNIRSANRGTLPALLMRWARDAVTQRVELRTGRARAEMLITDGELVGVRTNIGAVQLGKILVDRARIPPSQQQRARDLRTPRALATWARETLLLTPNDIHEVLVSMMRASLRMCLTWPGGTYRVFSGPENTANRIRLQIPTTLLNAVDAVPVQLALNCLEQRGPCALLRGPRIDDGAGLARDPICGALMNRRPASTPLAEVLRRLNAPTLDAARRVVLLTEMEVLAIGSATEAVGALEIRRKPSLRTAVGLDISPLAEQFELSLDDADTLTRLMLQACLVHVPKTEDATVDELVTMARMAVARTGRSAETTPADRQMLQAFTEHGLSVPDMCRFCAQLVDWLGLLGVDLHRLVPKKSVLGVVLYTER